jgi:hypothetical protein
LLTIILAAALVGSGGVVAWGYRGFHLPGNQQDYAPIQPIAFSHRMHAGELQIACLYCHTGADRSEHAGISAAGTCMNCHRFVTASSSEVFAELQKASQEGRPPRRIVSAELQKLYNALALDNLLQPDPNKKPQPIKWIRVHNLPAYTRFDHHAHVNAGVDCAECHGAVETMDRIEQVSDLAMGTCVRCHRDKIATAHKSKMLTDCASCHY